MPSVIRGVLFDLGSTLWQKIPAESWLPLEAEADARAGVLLREYAGGSGVESTHLLDPVSLGAALREATGAAISVAHRTTPDQEPEFALVCQEAAEILLGIPIDRALGASAFEALRIRLLLSRHLFSDALSALQELRERGYRLGVATNRAYGGAPFLEDIRQMGLMDVFTPAAIAVSGNLGIRKPNPALFQHALDGLALAPTEIAMVGDNMVADVWGAQRLGAFSVWRPSAKRLHLAQTSPLPTDGQLILAAQQKAHAKDPRTVGMAAPDVVIHHLSDLLDIFPQVP